MAQAQAGALGEFGREFSLALAAAYELDDFVAISRRNSRRRPLRAWKNLQVALYSDATRVQSERT